MKKYLVVAAVFFLLTAFKNDKPAYQLFDSEGKKIKYEKMLKEIAEADVVFFGELHNNPICHWLQLEVTKDLFIAREGNLILGAEMFERDNQLILNEYLTEKISEKSYEKEARLWPNYKTDYAPLVDFAKDSSLMFVATNVPRRYASVVYMNGFEGLDELEPEAKTYFAPPPIEFDASLPGYVKMTEMAGGHGGENLPKAQAIKDATMAYSIAEFAEEGKMFIHYNGTYHSDNFEGILWYLNKYKPGLEIVTIASLEQTDIDSLNEENLNKGNYILVVPEDMTKTH
jgi:uncharacterized iron-regulated protein